MMKKNKNKIYSLKIEIDELEIDIEKSILSEKPATARRLTMILERKQKLLDSWISNG